MLQKYDLVVVGGGFAGVSAALACAREGKKVLLIDRNYCLGGTTSASVINPFMRHYIEVRDGDKTHFEQLNCGIFKEIVDRMRKMDGVDDSDLANALFNIEYLKYVMEQMCEENGIDILFGTTVTSAETIDGVIKSIKFYNKSGEGSVSAKYFVDASGDANLSVLAGASTRLGRDEDHLCQPMTLCFWLSNVDMDKFWQERPQINPLYKKLQSEGKITNPRENVLIFKHVAPGILHFNTTRIIGLNPVNAEDVTKAQIMARKQIFEMFGFLRDNFDAFKNAVLLLSAPEIGVRESRMIDGEYVYTTDDILNYTHFDDSIAPGCYEIDMHSPDGTGTKLIYLDPTKYYTIPYRCLIPKCLRNLLVAGRCISTTHEAQSAYRIMPICSNIGEGAGAAISVLLSDGLDDTRKVDIEKVHALLSSHGARY